MMTHIATLFALAIVTLVLGALSAPLNAKPEAFEVERDRADEFPGGDEADAIPGDFILRNDKIEAVISHNSYRRKANMGTFWGDGNITPGCLYDLALRGSNNDQLTIFAPVDQKQRVSHVRVLKDGSDGEAIIETVTTAARGGGLSKRHEYRLRDGMQGVLVATTLHNGGKELRKVKTANGWKSFSKEGKVNGISWGDATNPAKKCGYAHGWISPLPAQVELQPGQTVTGVQFIAVGNSPAQAWGEVLAMQEKDAGTLHLKLKDPNTIDNALVGELKISAKVGDKSIAAYPGKNNEVSLRLPPGKTSLTISSIGREPLTKEVTIAKGETTSLEVDLPDAAIAGFDVRDEKGKEIPFKVQFIGVEGTKTPNFGPANRAAGCVDQFHSADGNVWFEAPPGKYRVIITRGVEYAHHSEVIEIKRGKFSPVKATLKRIVDTSGWVSTDFHNHSTPSGDNTCGTDDRIINLAAEHIEFAPTTEHNRIYDWKPHIDKLDLADEISTVVGIELTGSGAHFNAFPFKPQPHLQDGGAPEWQKDPRLNAIVLRDYQGHEPDRWIHLNHPDMVENFIDRRGDEGRDGGFLKLDSFINALETENYRGVGILNTAPYTVSKPFQNNNNRISWSRQFLWLQTLNQGIKTYAVAVADAHSVHGNGVGGWRTFIPSSTDDPEKIDWKEIVRNAKQGNMILTNAPFLEVKLSDGTPPGATTSVTNKKAELAIKVQCTDWTDIDRVQVLVNGRQLSKLNFTRKSHPRMFGDGVVKFDQTIPVALKEDSHLIVVATGENFDLKTCFGTSPQAKMQPCAYNNPIYVDVDGNGFQANGDTLDYPLPQKGLTVQEAEAAIKAAKEKAQ